jgi:hypothetical protein
MKRYILRHKSNSAAPQEDCQKISNAKGIKVVDATPRMLLVEADEATMQKITARFPDWSCSEEKTIPLPDTKKKINGA